MHTLLGLQTFDAVLGNPLSGQSWEGLCIENILNSLSSLQLEYGFYQTANGNEIDLVLKASSSKIFAFEFKASKTPKITRSLTVGMESIGAKKAFIVAPVDSPYDLNEKVKVIAPEDLLGEIS